MSQTFEYALDLRLVGMARRFAENLMETRPRDQLIEREGDPYIERWYLARKGKVPGNSARGDFSDEVPLIPSELENIYLHRYVRADAEEPHCHPWANATLVLKGWYDEQIWRDGQLVETIHRKVGDAVLRRADEVHAIVAVEPGTISAFATLPKERDWGFHTADGFIPWPEFREWKRSKAAAA